MTIETYVRNELESLKSRVKILESQMADLLRQDENESAPDEEAIKILKSKIEALENERQAIFNDRVKVYKDLFDWAESTKEQVIYLQSRMYAVRVDNEMVVLVKANNYDDAIRRVWAE